MTKMTLVEVEMAISDIYKRAAQHAPGVTLDSTEGTLGWLWDQADDYYAKER